MNPRRLHRCALLALLILPSAGTLSAQDGYTANYAAFELRREDNWGPLRFIDLDGANGRDIVVPHFDPALGRELHVYYQQRNGGFSAEPARIEIKTEIIAVDFADLRPEPGMELVLFANAGVFSLSPRIASYSGNLRLLFEWDLLATIPDPEAVRFTNLVTDINGDGHVDIVAPGDDRYGVFLGQGDEEFAPAATLSTLNADLTPIQRRSFDTDLDGNLAINAEQGVVIELTVTTPTPFAGFVEAWRPGTAGDGALLNTEQWMPNVVLARLNDDRLPDLAYINAGDDGLGRLNIHYQAGDSGIRSEPDWQQDLDSSGQLRFEDLNGDGLQDLLQLRGDGDEWTARFFLNRGGEFDFQRADQVMRFSGYEVTLDILRLAEDEPPVLNVSYYTIPVVDALRNASINRVQLLYAPGGENLFPNRPSSRLEESFSADNVRGLSEQMTLRFDVDGDGRKDALYITGNGTVAARRIGDDLQIASEPFWEYVAPRSVFEFEVMDLNGDTLPDLLLRHGTSSTILVARS